MTIRHDLTLLKKIGLKAADCVRAGKLRAARKFLRTIEKSPYSTEADRIRLPLEASIEIRKGETAAARRIILESMESLWNCDDALVLLRQTQPEVTERSRLFELTVMGGQATFGLFTRFSSHHCVDFLVVAETREEALRYVDEVCRFADASERKLLRFQSRGEPDGAADRHGIYWSSAFYLANGGPSPTQVLEAERRALH